MVDEVQRGEVGRVTAVAAAAAVLEGRVQSGSAAAVRRA